MSWEDKYDAMSDYNEEQAAEGRDELLGELKEYFAAQPNEHFLKQDILDILDEFE